MRERGARRPGAAAALVAVVLAAGVVVLGPTTGHGGGTAPADAATPPFRGPEPVVLVHGWNNDARSMETLAGRFRSAGFPSSRLFVFEYDDTASTQTTASKLETFVQQVLASTGAPEVDVVAYSMGSLSTRWCIRFLGCGPVVDDWVSLGGPNRGTFWSSFCAPFSTGCGDMAPGSNVLATLNAGDPTPGERTSWATYRTSCDLVIVPSENTMLDGADNVLLDGCLSHDDLVTDAGVFELVRARVDERAAPSAAQDLTGSAGDAAVTLRWEPPADDGGDPVTGYQVLADGEVRRTVPAPADGTAAATTTVTGLVNGQAVDWSVRAVNGRGAGPPSGVLTLTPVAAPPPPPPPPPEERFTDVPVTHPFFVEVEWVANEGVAGGYADGTFRPGAPVTRQAMAAFLHRLAGSPSSDPGWPSFRDVSEAHPFFEPIEWVASARVAGGYPDGTFRPGAPVTRQAMAAFLHRLAGSPWVDPGPPTFRDVGEAHPFFREVAWASSLGVVRGYGDGTFRGGATVTRQAMAAFLQRFASEVGVP